MKINIIYGYVSLITSTLHCVDYTVTASVKVGDKFCINSLNCLKLWTDFTHVLTERVLEFLTKTNIYFFFYSNFGNSYSVFICIFFFFKFQLTLGKQKEKPGDFNTLYHTNRTFNNLEKEALMKTLWEKEKILVTSIFSFSHNVFYPSQHKYQFFTNIYLCRLQNAFNLDQSENLSFGKEDIVCM